MSTVTTPRLILMRETRPEPRTERITVFVSKSTKRYLRERAAEERKALKSKRIKPATVAADAIEAAALAATAPDPAPVAAERRHGDRRTGDHDPETAAA
jgi:hypothetical protein